MKRLFVLLVFASFAVAQVNNSDGSASSSDETYPDDAIGTDQSAPQAAFPAPADEVPAAPAEPERKQLPQYGSGPDLDEPAQNPAGRPQQSTGGGDRYSTTPKIDRTVVQETPDIPEFSHKKHIEDVGAECVQCHQTLFSESVRGIKSGPSMKEICSQCHNGTDAPAEMLVGFNDEKKYVKTTMPLFSHEKHTQYTEDCKTCHRDIYRDLKKIKTPPPMSVCTECHNNDKANASCKVCHEDPSRLKPKSHTPRWVYRNGHGTEAKYDQSQCRACHADRECYACHRGQSSFAVHRPGYKFTHGMDARQREVNCSHCHETVNSCARCHERTR
jgi:predicted CXXCH cytochrome family protein